MATIAEILRMTVEQRKADYKAPDIDKVKIDGNTFSDYKAFSFLWEKSYVKEPERSGDGSITNLNSYATFVTPHLKIDFSMMSIDSYRVLMRLLYERNEHDVECYDVVQNDVIETKMYFATEEMPKLWAIARALNGEEWVELLGVQDYTVEMIGTNTEIDTYHLTYHLNKPTNASWDGNEDEVAIAFAKNTSINIGAGASLTKNGEPTKIQSITFDGNYKFNGWKTLNGIKYEDGKEYYLMGTTSLWAQWVSTK